jgi:hypothetical protein
MFTAQQKLYINSKVNFTRWKAASIAVTSFTAIPISLSAWEILNNSDILKLAIYLIFAVVIIAVRVICAGKVAFHAAAIELIKTRLDHPPDSENELKGGQISSNIGRGA